MSDPPDWRLTSARVAAEGEGYAQLFLSRFFEYSAKPVPDLGVDWQCGGLLGSAGSPTFHIQVKATSNSHRRAIHVKRRTFSRWLNLVETEPVLILLIERAMTLRFRVRFLVFHEWVLTHVEEADVFRGTDDVVFRPNDFTSIDDDSHDEFRLALQREAARAAALPGATFGTSRNARLFLVDEGQLFQQVENVAYFEVPYQVLRELVDDHRLTDYGQLRGIARTLWADPTHWSSNVREWITDLQSELSRVAVGSSAQRAQFGTFVRAMRAYRDGRPVSLPPFTVGNVICWRAFVTMYPESIEMISSVLRAREQRRAEERAFVLCLLSILVNTGVRPLEGRAADAFRLVSAEISAIPTSLASYRLAREYYKNLIEAGIASRAERALGIRLLRDEAHRSWEAAHLGLYGWGGDEAVLRNLERKLTKPKVRDINTMSFHEAQREMLVRPRRGRP